MGQPPPSLVSDKALPHTEQNLPEQKDPRWPNPSGLADLPREKEAGNGRERRAGPALPCLSHRIRNPSFYIQEIRLGHQGEHGPLQKSKQRHSTEKEKLINFGAVFQTPHLAHFSTF